MENILSTLLVNSPFTAIKIAILILLILYLAFGFIVYRQTNQMAKVVEADVTSTIKLASLIHFLAIVFVFFWAIIFL